MLKCTGVLFCDFSFEQKRQTTIRGKRYVQYQQFYKGIKVENGGFTVSYRIVKNPDDCLEAYLLSLGIVDKLDKVIVDALISDAEIKNIMESHPINVTTYPSLKPVVDPEIRAAVDAELLISNTGTTNCRNRLIWKANYRWNFPLEWTVAGNPVGNTVYGECLTVLDFPEYNYYPRSFWVQVWSENSGDPQRLRVTLEDCDGDDPSCAKYFASLEETKYLQPNDNPWELNQLDKDLLEIQKSEATMLKVFDIRGSLLFEGEASVYNNDLLGYQSGVLIYVWFDEQGRIITSEKRLNFR